MIGAKREDFTEKTITEGVKLACFRTGSFKSSMMTVSFVTRLDKATASGYSLLTNLLSIATAKHRTMRDFSEAKDDVYALGLDSFVQRRGELLLISFELTAVADEYALEGEKILDRAVEILGEAIFDPLLDENGVFPESSIKSEKANLIDEIESIIENKQSYAMLRAREAMCGGEPFAVDAAGEVEEVNRLDGKALYEYYRKCVSELQVFITYAGPASADYVLSCVERHLPFKPRHCAIPAPVTHRFGGSVIERRDTMDMEQCILVLGFVCPQPENAFDRAVLSVADEIFGGSSSSRLFANVREKEGLWYYCYTYPSGRKNVYFTSCGVDPEDVTRAKEAILREMRSIADGNISDSELDTAKNSVIRSIETFDASLSGITGYLLGQSLVGTENLFDSLAANVKLVSSVTAKDVAELFSQFELELIYTMAGGERRPDTEADSCITS